jgi:hypothetical protein
MTPFNCTVLIDVSDSCWWRRCCLAKSVSSTTPVSCSPRVGLGIHGILKEKGDLEYETEASGASLVRRSQDRQWLIELIELKHHATCTGISYAVVFLAPAALISLVETCTVGLSSPLRVFYNKLKLQFAEARVV